MDKVLASAVFFKFFLNLSGPPKIGSFLIIILKLYSYKDSDARNIRKIILDLCIRHEILFNSCFLGLHVMNIRGLLLVPYMHMYVFLQGIL